MNSAPNVPAPEPAARSSQSGIQWLEVLVLLAAFGFWWLNTLERPTKLGVAVGWPLATYEVRDVLPPEGGRMPWPPPLRPEPHPFPMFVNLVICCAFLCTIPALRWLRVGERATLSLAGLFTITVGMAFFFVCLPRSLPVWSWLLVLPAGATFVASTALVAAGLRKLTKRDEAAISLASEAAASDDE